jgi:hypothetical protein
MTRTRLFEEEDAARLKENRLEGEEKVKAAMEVLVRGGDREWNCDGCRRRGLGMRERIEGGNRRVALMKLE